MTGDVSTLPCLARQSGVPCPTGYDGRGGYCLNCIARMERRSADLAADTHRIFMSCKPCRMMLASHEINLERWPAGLVVTHRQKHGPTV